MGAWSYKEFGAVRREYELSRMDESKLPDDPILLFVEWIQKAGTSGIPDPTAMTLSTVDERGSPSSRIVLLKKIDQNRLIFFTNYRSRKAKEIRNNPGVAAHFYWPQLERQLKISGVAQRLEDLESDLYFSSRPFESKVAAWASPQSEVVPDRDYLEKQYQLYLEKYEGSGEVPRPAFWGGIAIDPRYMEFWQGGLHRLHDRFAYTKKEVGWSRVRLAP
jgi:pyridoxamine 5'-phosphate oxidase